MMVVFELMSIILCFVMVCIYFARLGPDEPIPPTYVISPESGGCRAWVEGDCLKVDAPSLKLLKGMIPVAERRSLGLFSEMNPAIILLTIQVIGASVSLGMLSHLSTWSAHLHEQKEDARWFFRKVGLVLLMACAALLLFMRNAWSIPQNHLLWLKLLIGMAIVLLCRTHTASWWTTGLVINAFTMPAICVATLSAAGEPDTEVLLLTYGGLCGVPLILLGHGRATVAERGGMMMLQWPVGGTILILVAPFVVFASLRIHESPSSWGIAGLSLAIAWVILTAIGLSMAFCSSSFLLFHSNDYWSGGDAKGRKSAPPSSSSLARFFVWSQLGSGFLISLILLIGLLATTTAPSGA